VFWAYGFGWQRLVFGGLMMLLVWGGLIALAVLVVRALTRPVSRQPGGSGGPSGSTIDRALEILKERYARGEITKDQYESMRRDLQT